MAQFHVYTSTLLTVEVDDAFIAEHEDNTDCIADCIACQFNLGNCEVVDTTLLTFTCASGTEPVYDF